jgi:hypothetical protein
MTTSITYDELGSHYTRKAPQGFKEFAKAHGVDSPNTCAVRLAYALFLADKGFFKDFDAKLEWYGLPTRADELAPLLNEKFGKATRVDRSQISGKNVKRGIVFFDTITGFGGSGHISLWNGSKVVDGGDYFDDSPRVYFWPLP